MQRAVALLVMALLACFTVTPGAAGRELLAGKACVRGEAVMIRRGSEECQALQRLTVWHRISFSVQVWKHYWAPADLTGRWHLSCGRAILRLQA